MLFRPGFLIQQHARCTARHAHIEQHERIAKVLNGGFAHLKRIDAGRAILAVFLAQYPAVRGNILVLFSHWLCQPVHLNFDGLLGQRFGAYRIALISMQGVDQTYQESSGGAQACTRRDVGDAYNLDGLGIS